MKKTLVTALAGILGGSLVISTAVLVADEYEEHEQHETHQHQPNRGRLGVVDNTAYGEECGACHFAYQPGLLPAASWEKLMGGLSDHFGENAELPAETLQALNAYLSENAADKKPNAIYRELAGGREEAPLRISELSRFKNEHREIPAKMVADNPDVQSLSHCNRCHSDAADGVYDEHRVSIPGFGRWED